LRYSRPHYRSHEGVLHPPKVPPRNPELEQARDKLRRIKNTLEERGVSGEVQDTGWRVALVVPFAYSKREGILDETGEQQVDEFAESIATGLVTRGSVISLGTIYEEIPERMTDQEAAASALRAVQQVRERILRVVPGPRAEYANRVYSFCQRASQTAEDQITYPEGQLRVEILVTRISESQGRSESDE
jgi:hypothetical protein